jgi:hypothetical protein
VSNSSENYSELFIVSVPRKPEFSKPECSVLEFEFLIRFFVNLFLEVLQVMVIS